MHEYKVKSISNKGVHKIITLDNNSKSIKVKVHRYSIVGPNDTLLISTKKSDNVYVKTLTGGKLTIQPHFEHHSVIKLGDLKIQTRITEIITTEDMENYSFLEKYHYKSMSNLGDDNEFEATPGGGRKSILLLYLKLPGRWESVGYIELQMPLMMCKPRHILFNNPYNNKQKQIQWEKWDQDAIKNYVNQIVRVARVVTAPEYRGLSLSKILIKAAKEFAVSRWHIKGKSPIFMEISAEMLKYIDFVSSAGFAFVGNTEGNISRVHKDLSYMNRGYNVSSGIMSLQKKYLTKFKEMANELNIDFSKALKNLTKLCSSTNIENALNRLKIQEYYLYKSVLRLPIPYYIMALDEYSEKYLSNHVLPKDSKEIGEGNKETLVIQNMSVSASYSLRTSKYVRAILSGFGLKGDTLNQKIINRLSLKASPGNVVFISGNSGTGKSVLIDILYKKVGSKIKVTNDENNIRQFNISKLSDIESKLPLIEYFSKTYGIEQSLSALNRAGLSEAFVYLKPYYLLSKGQQYRARFAKLILEDSDIWLLDEFCSDLDVLTAKIVATNLTHIVHKYSKIAIVAAANHEHFIDALKPSQIVILSNGRNTRIVSHKDYKYELFSGKQDNK